MQDINKWVNYEKAWEGIQELSVQSAQYSMKLNLL